MKDMIFGIAMIMAGIFCAVVGLQHELMFYLGGLFVAIGIVVALVAEFGGGLVNNPDAVETTAANGAAGTATWATKTPDEILKDVNDALSAGWAANEYDESAIPNHILLPYEQYLYIMTTKVTELATETIYDFLMKNNAATKAGGDLFIGATRWCKGAGTSGKDRMVVYNNDRRFVKMDELVPLNRIMSQPNVANVCYDTAYMANISEVQLFYPTSLRYVDGI